MPCLSERLGFMLWIMCWLMQRQGKWRLLFLERRNTDIQYLKYKQI